ncbi:hypothetical protein Tco_0738628 [Tanacetum coccineum]
MLPVHSHNPKVTDTNVPEKATKPCIHIRNDGIDTHDCSLLNSNKLKEESNILWKLTLLFPGLRVMVPVSNLILDLAVVRNGVYKMKGLFLFSLISRITKSTGNTCSATSTNTYSAIPKG